MATKNLKIRFVLIAAVCFLTYSTRAQIDEPVKWSYNVQYNNNIATVNIIADVESSWHLYSQYNTEGITQQTVFTFTPSENYKLIGKTTEPGYTELKDDFGIDRYFDMPKVKFSQKIEILTGQNFTIPLSIDAQACTDGKCVMAGKDLNIPIKGVELAKDSQTETGTIAEDIAEEEQEADADNVAEEYVKPALDNNDAQNTTKDKSMGLVFLVSLLAGLLALITPCVFPMIPMTISFFMKGQKSQRQGIEQAIFFGLSIIFIFAVLGLILTLLLGKDAMYIISTHWIPNLIFFIIFMIFAFSFFGLFEITLPSSWINTSDKQSEKSGYIGAFFIALTTVLVSFSCTGPILGAALIEMASGSSNSIVFFISMLGFALGFALPFTFLAMFPSVIKKMKSGAWLNSVKIVFGFLEIALGLKFLSMADLSAGWGILDRETYLALWIVTFSMLGFYFLGKLQFKGDEPIDHVSVPRLFLSLITFAFVVYMIPGLWGAPLKAISGYIPPMTTQDFDMERIVVENRGGHAGFNSLPANRKYADQLHLPTGFEGFFDLEEAKAYAKSVNKPIFIDFTGKTCANCREMENYVWTHPQVKKLLQEQYVMVALYADANTITLDSNEWISNADGSIIKTLGKKNLNYQMEHYNMNAQPFYVLIDAQGNMLTKEPKSYDRNVNNFVAFLEEGLNNFKQQ
ncbi:MAG: thioredoxin family protein [Bacteroidales bacterium]|nr:thioredoxin family protein [Bacteroidales bacterium]